MDYKDRLPYHKANLICDTIERGDVWRLGIKTKDHDVLATFALGGEPTLEHLRVIMDALGKAVKPRMKVFELVRRDDDGEDCYTMLMREAVSEWLNNGVREVPPQAIIQQAWDEHFNLDEGSFWEEIERHFREAKRLENRQYLVEELRTLIFFDDFKAMIKDQVMTVNEFNPDFYLDKAIVVTNFLFTPFKLLRDHDVHVEATYHYQCI